MTDINIAGAMAIVIATWLITFCVIAGLGQFVRKAFRADSNSIDTWFSAFWVGYAVLIGALHWWHFLLPIDWRVSLLLAVIGLIGFFWGLKSIRLSRHLLLKAAITILLLAPVVIWLANRALDGQLDFDSGFYHINSIRWLNEYPAVIGLGNLHYRLAFNQSLFMFVAALNIFPYFNQGYHIANSLLMMTLLAQCAVAWVKLLFAPTTQPAYLLSIVLLPVLLYRASYQPFSSNISSPSPDLSVFVFMVVVMIYFVRYITPIEDGAEQRFTAFSIIAVSAVGITSKLSFAAFGATMIILTSLVWLWKYRTTHLSVSGKPDRAVAVPTTNPVGTATALSAAFRQLLIWLTSVGLLIGLPWIGHGLIASGYPVFPATIGALPVDWKVPTSITVEARDWIYSFARERNNDMYAVLGSWDWLKSWFSNVQHSLFNNFLLVLPVLVFLAEIPIALITGLFFRKRIQRQPRLWLPFLPVLISALFWFITAPDPRFAGAAFWLLALWTLVVVLSSIKIQPRQLVYPVLAIVLVIAIVICVAIFPVHFRHDGKGFPSLPTARMDTFRTDSGLVVYVPAGGSLLLWDSPIPSSPYKLPKLELRGSDLRDGFRMRPED